MAVIEQQEAPAKSGPSLVIQIAVLLVLTAAAIGMGWFSGGYLNSTRDAGPQKAENPSRVDKAHVKTTDKAATLKDGKPAAAGDELGVLPIEAITTNLAAPSDIWVRMELSLVFDGNPDGTGTGAILLRCEIQVHMSLLGELDRIAGQIEGDLAQRTAIRIRHQRL